jgi:hypothetical protein
MAAAIVIAVAVLPADKQAAPVQDHDQRREY